MGKLFTPHERRMFRIYKKLYPRFFNGVTEKTYAKPLTSAQTKASRKLVKWGTRGHHNLPLSFNGEANPGSRYLTPTGETRIQKNPDHTDITNFWNGVLRRLRAERGIK